MIFFSKKLPFKDNGPNVSFVDKILPIWSKTRTDKTTLFWLFQNNSQKYFRIIVANYLVSDCFLNVIIGILFKRKFNICDMFDCIWNAFLFKSNSFLPILCIQLLIFMLKRELTVVMSIFKKVLSLNIYAFWFWQTKYKLF